MNPLQFERTGQDGVEHHDQTGSLTCSLELAGHLIYNDAAEAEPEQLIWALWLFDADRLNVGSGNVLDGGHPAL